MTDISPTITPAELLETIKSLPVIPEIYNDLEMQERLITLLNERPANAFVTRVLYYSVAPDSQTESLLAGTLKVHDACRALDGEMQLIEMDTDTNPDNDNARAAAFGLMAAEESTGLIITAALGAQEGDPADLLNTTTPNVAALLGVFVSAAQAKIPVIAEGEGAFLAAEALNNIRPDMMPYIFVCETSSDDETGPAYSACMLAAWALLSGDDAEDVE